ncbi:hypothetical protein FHR78_000899 [Frigoribacterium faeni]|nr:hypothetical protein [Frigoribacterium faeni]
MTPLHRTSSCAAVTARRAGASDAPAPSWAAAPGATAAR